MSAARRLFENYLLGNKHVEYVRFRGMGMLFFRKDVLGGEQCVSQALEYKYERNHVKFTAFYWRARYRMMSLKGLKQSKTHANKFCPGTGSNLARNALPPLPSFPPLPSLGNEYRTSRQKRFGSFQLGKFQLGKRQLGKRTVRQTYSSANFTSANVHFGKFQRGNCTSRQVAVFSEVRLRSHSRERRKTSSLLEAKFTTAARRSQQHYAGSIPIRSMCLRRHEFARIH